ncbi:MAG: sensor histidine kinase, partial [Actinomycetes bacterium]
GSPILEVEDTGPGIPEADRERVFERFYRVLGSGVDGSGLGLPIVRSLVEKRLAGRVELHSDGESGTTARVSLPWDRDAVKTDAPVPIDEDDAVTIGHA